MRPSGGSVHGQQFVMHCDGTALHAASYHGNVFVSPYDTINLSDIEPPDLGIESMFDKVKGMDTIKALLNDDDLYAAKVASIKEAAQQSSMSDDEMHAALLEAKNNTIEEWIFKSTTSVPEVWHGLQLLLAWQHDLKPYI